MKKCAICGDLFTPQRSTEKACPQDKAEWTALRLKRWRAANFEHKAAYDAAWREANPDYHREYYRRNFA